MSMSRRGPPMLAQPQSSEEKAKRSKMGTMGFYVSPQMRALADKPGYLKGDEAQMLRDMYVAESVNQNPGLANPFAQACYCGSLDLVKKAFSTSEGLPSDLHGTETDFRISYVMLVILGSTRVEFPSNPSLLKHAETLTYLISKGLPVDTGDIAGYTALFHSVMNVPNLNLARILLKAGASPDYRNRFGEMALLPCMMQGHLDSVELLLEHGADLDLADPDGITPRSFYVKAGPKVAAVVEKWIRKRTGAPEAPLEQAKACKTCGKKPEDGIKLSTCNACRLVRYCSRECQRKDWPSHKSVCKSADKRESVTVYPSYAANDTTLLSISDLARKSMKSHPNLNLPDISQHAPTTTTDPIKEASNMVIKIQLPVGGNPLVSPIPADRGGMMVYNRKRTFRATIEAQGNEQAYRELQRAVREKGVKFNGRGEGLKAYFLADLESPQKLVIRIGEVLAEQPW